MRNARQAVTMSSEPNQTEVKMGTSFEIDLVRHPRLAVKCIQDRAMLVDV